MEYRYVEKELYLDSPFIQDAKYIDGDVFMTLTGYKETTRAGVITQTEHNIKLKLSMANIRCLARTLHSLCNQQAEDWQSTKNALKGSG